MIECMPLVVGVPGPELEPEQLHILEDIQPAGVILFQRNIQSIGQVREMVSELAGLRHENVYLADDTLFFPHRRVHEYAKALFEAVAPLEKKFFVSSTLALNTDPKFLDLAARAGVKNFYCTMNVDPVSIKALRGEKNERRQLVDLRLDWRQCCGNGFWGGYRSG